MPFEWKTAKEEKLLAELHNFSAGQSSFNLGLDGFGCFAPRVIFIHVIDNPQLSALHNDLMKFCKVQFNIFNARYKDQAYHPHLTVAFRDLRKAPFHQAWEEFKAKAFRADFAVKTFALLKHDGRRWNVFREFSLA